MSFEWVEIGELQAKKNGSIDPSKFLDETFELHSIPSHDKGNAEILTGREIGSSKQIVQENDVMISKIVPHIRRAMVVPKKGDFRQIASGEWIVFRSEKVYPNYLRHLLISDFFNAEFMATVSGVGGSLLRARPAFVSKIKIPLPPLSEQKRIAEILDKADELRQKRQQSIEKLDELLQATFIDMFGDPISNSNNLKVIELSQLCQKVTDGTHQSPKWENEGIPFLFISNIVNGEIDYSSNKYISQETYNQLTKSTKIEINDILYTTVGSYGNVARVKTDKLFCFQRHIGHIKPNQSKVNAVFLENMLSSFGVKMQADRLVKGVAQKTLNLKDLKSLLVFDIPIIEQENFVKISNKIKMQKQTLTAQLTEQENLFKSLQQRAFNGEL